MAENDNHGSKADQLHSSHPVEGRDPTQSESNYVRPKMWRPSPRTLTSDERTEAKEVYAMFDLDATGKMRIRPLKMALRALGIKVHIYSFCYRLGCCGIYVFHALCNQRYIVSYQQEVLLQEVPTT